MIVDIGQADRDELQRLREENAWLRAGVVALSGGRAGLKRYLAAYGISPLRKDGSGRTFDGLRGLVIESLREYVQDAPPPEATA